MYRTSDQVEINIQLTHLHMTFLQNNIILQISEIPTKLQCSVKIFFEQIFDRYFGRFFDRFLDRVYVRFLE